MKARKLIWITVVSLLTLASRASELRIHLKGNDPVTHSVRHLSCDSSGVALGLPSGTFDVEYINGAGNSLAVLPINGKSIIFVNVPSGSGARYVAGVFTWADGGSRGAYLSLDNPRGAQTVNCQSHP